MLYYNPRDITLVEMDKKIGRGLGSSTRWSMLADLKRLGIKTLVKHKVLEVGSQGVLVEAEGETRWLPARTVVVATGAVANDHLYRDLKTAQINCHVIGDAAGPRSVLEAVREAFDLAGAI